MTGKTIAKFTEKLKKALLVTLGTLSVALGVLGIFLPLLPTTPFLLLAAACYAKSSDKFYNWLINNKVFGNYIKQYRESKTLPLRIKITAITFLWVTILISVAFVIKALWVKLLLIIIAIAVTLHISKLKTQKK